MKPFDITNSRLVHQYEQIAWIPDSGISPEEFASEFEKLMARSAHTSHALIKAETFALILERARIAVDPDDIFQDKVWAGGYLNRQRSLWERELVTANMAPELEEMNFAMGECGAYRGAGDYGHTSPNSRLLLETGFPGLLARVEKAASREGLTREQEDFYASCRIVLQGVLCLLRRMADAVAPYNPENRDALVRLAQGAPSTLYEAMQLIVIYFFLHEYAGATRVRTLGRLDVLLEPFYLRDLEQGRITEQDAREMLKFFLHKFWAAKVPYDLPFCIGGTDAGGREVTGTFTRLIVETYDSLNIHSPKIHVRVSRKTPPDFVKLVLDCIRRGNSSFVFINDEVGIQSLINVGITPEDAADFVAIGCYELSAWGREIPCTGNGPVNMAKAMELVITGGLDAASGKRLTPDTGTPETFDAFLDALKFHLRYMIDRVIRFVTMIEAYYDRISPDPLLSAMYDESVERGVDVFAGGAKYNNSSVNCACVATLVDSAMVVRQLVYEEKKLTFDELRGILLADWEGQEKLRLTARSLPRKFGCGDALTDAVAKELLEFCADCINNRPNGRGGVFKASSFSIDRYVSYGEKTMATPDGRHKGEPLSKNMCASIGMDRCGMTGLIRSVCSIDYTRFSNGSVLDILLHPSSVQGADGLDAFHGLIRTYLNKGGLAVHGNVFDPKDLREAQKNPDKYRNLQVRVCGWNAYFVDLSKAEQDAFIRQAECLA